MSGNYKSLVNKILPNAVVTVYRFYVTKMIHEKLNKAIIDHQKKAAGSLEIKERSQLFSSLKGSKYILLKAESNCSGKKQNYYKCNQHHCS